jgi:hypothetical protein
MICAMNKIIAALLLSLMPLMAMESKSPEVEMYQNKGSKSVPVLKNYPNQIPKSQLIMLLKNPESEDIFKKKDTTQYSFQVVDRIMDNNGFKKLNKTLASPESIYMRYERNELIDFVMVHFKAFSQTFAPIFYDIEYTVNPSSKRKDKWERQTKVEYDLNKTESVYEMSWRYMDFALHFSRRLSISHTEAEQLLYSKIKKVGFQNSIIRLTVVDDVINHLYGFSVLYDDEIEKNTGRKFLLNLIVPGTYLPIEEEITPQIPHEKTLIKNKKEINCLDNCNVF